jgi:hypothetical protein
MRRGIFTRTAVATALAVALAAFGVAASALNDSLDTRRLFQIERSKNANIVAYDARVRPDGSLDEAKPVEAYWVKLASDGSRAKLTAIQRRMAYGFKTRFDADGTLVIKMAAEIDREIKVTRLGGEWRALVDIDGAPAVLDRIWVQAQDHKLWPTVEWVDLHGTDARTGNERTERIVP